MHTTRNPALRLASAGVATLLAVALAACGDDEGNGETDAADTTEGASELTIEDVWARTSAPGQVHGAAYMVITGGGEDDRLLGASVDASVACKTEVHETVVAEEGGSGTTMAEEGGSETTMAEEGGSETTMAEEGGTETSMTEEGGSDMTTSEGEDDCPEGGEMGSDMGGSGESDTTAMGGTGEGEMGEGESSDTTAMGGEEGDSSDTTAMEGEEGEGEGGTGGMAEGMTMREVEAIDVPAGEEVTLEPGGYHVMLLGLEAPLETGDEFDIELEFENAGTQTVTAEVRER